MKKRAIIWWGVLLFVIGAIVYGSWASRGRIKRVYASSGIYKLDMQVAVKSKEPGNVDGKIIKHWRMDIPNAYIYKHFGLNGVPGRTRSGKINQYGIRLDTVLDPDTLTIGPRSPQSAVESEYAMSIRLRNAGGNRKYEASNRCLKPAEIDNMLGRDKPILFPCKSQRCPLRTHIDGWSVSITIARKFYDNPETAQQFCQATKEFLQSMTVSRDSFQYKKSENQ
ncbi:MAG TPA: hypothetical protein ENJ46_01885 [Hellea balneolensis]|uniref:Uncharacterized protein n=1 Tax=Hellea balneolensis TaxID=287478 RepID=A0A7C3C557_9PROT|nr:hypothetical protein [Hellea balneolensis]